MRLFFGWVVVAAAFTVMMTGFGVAYSFSAFFLSLETEFHAPRADISLVFSICGFLYFLLGIVGGPMADLIGARRVIGIGVLLIGLGLIGASIATELWQVYAFYSVGVGVGVGLSYVPSVGVVQRWFVRRRGMASGLAVAGIGLGTMGGPMVAAALIDAGGWRGAFLTLAVVSLALGLFATWFLHGTPQARGLWPDGEKLPAGTVPAPQWGMDLFPALTSRPFIVIYVSAALVSLGLFTPFVHLERDAADLGVLKGGISLVSLIGLGSLLGRFFLGGLADGFGRYRTMAVMYAGIAVMQIWWFEATTYWALASFAVIFGIFYGGFVALAPALSADYFGTRHAGGIIGVLYTGPAFGAFLGPAGAGLVYDTWQSYDVAILAAAATGFVGLAMLLLATPSPARWRERLVQEEGLKVVEAEPSGGNRQEAGANAGLTVAIGGLGAIGLPVARALDEGKVPGLRLVAVSARDRERARSRIAGFRNPVPVVGLAELAELADVVVECVPAASFDEIARPAVERGRILLPLSVGALLSRQDLIDRAGETGARIIVPTGALLGLDAVRAAAEGAIQSVRMVTRKPPEGLKNAPHLREHDISLDDLTDPLRVFSGSAREAAKGFPANINVAAALSLAGVGADRTQVEIWADPTVERNTHTITVDGDASRFVMTIEGIPSPENPATGRLTPLSTLATLRALVSPMRVGT